MSSLVLIQPGIGNSGPEHWQSRWEASSPEFIRIMQADWDHPVREDWVATLEESVRRAGPGAVIVAHSLGCLAVAHWASTSHSPIKAALLVAVPDPLGENFPSDALGFDNLPMQRLAFPTTLVASENDPYSSMSFSQRCATQWGSRRVNIGPAGHINAASGLGDWPAGRELLEELRR
jgi:predicted alpha/beta hydrolase family esterase